MEARREGSGRTEIETFVLAFFDWCTFSEKYLAAFHSNDGGGGGGNRAGHHENSCHIVCGTASGHLLTQMHMRWQTESAARAHAVHMIA